MSYRVQKTNFRSSSSGETLTTNGTIINLSAVNSGVEFDGTGSWTFMDDYEDSGSNCRMVLIQGTLITNGNNLNINGFQSQGAGVRHLDLGSSEITIRTPANYSWHYYGTNATLDAGTSHINLVGALMSTDTNRGFRGALNHAYHHVTYSNPLSTVGHFNGPVFVEKLTFMGNATIVSSSNTIDTLILSAGKKYAFGGGQTQTIGSYLSANSPLCSGLIEMVSATAGSATLQFSPGSVANINNTLIENIAATGNVPVTANNSFDLGGNTNFIFPPATGQTLYWVGGSGDWNDASHWSLVNDGVYPAVGGCVPTPADDVVFNVNSGFTSGNNVVTLDGAGHYCHDMTWVGAQATPIIIGTVSNPLNVYGSWTLQANMSYRVQKTNFRSSSLGETLTTNGTIINLSATNSGVEFDGTGSWTFMDDYEDSGNLGLMVLIQGTLITNGNNLNINGFQSQGSGVRHLDLGSSEITIRTSGSYSWYYQGSNHTIDAGTSHIKLVEALNSTGVNTGFRGALNHAYHHVTYSNPLSTVGRFSGPVFVEKLTFMGNATIVSSSNTIDTLILSAGKKYAFGGGQTQTIGSYLSANSPLCSGLIEMVSATAGSATLQFSPGSVANINNTLIENIAATGNVPVTANNSFDLGGNTNFIFPPATGQTLYWVGGSGDWNDASHWSLVNDGVYPAVGGCVPTPADDVVFNVNSGFTSGNNVVTLDGAGHYCHDMTWVGAQATPIIIGTVSNPLNVYGSWTLQANMSYRVQKTNFRSSSLGETLTTNGTIINLSAVNSGVEFDGTGSWMFMDDYEDSGSNCLMVLIQGTLITNGNNLNINGFQSQGSGVRHLDLGSSEITIRTSGSYSWYYQGSNHTIDAGTSHINLVGALNFTGVNTGFRGALNHAYHHVTYSNPLSTVGRFSGPVFVEKLTFMGNATIVSSSNTIDTLILSAGKKYAFGGGQTQTIGSYLSANSPLCSGLIEMVSATAGSATLQFSPGSVANINNTLIENIAATGNVPVTANNSFDLGGNTNFIFPPATGQTLYWVGGSGDWNDASHWSLVNDGVYPAVGGCVPTPADDVVFNVNSGFTSGNNVVTLDGAGHYCHDMTWNGALNTPEIIGAVGNPLNVYGSWTLQANMSYRVQKTNFRSSSLGETLTTNGTIINLSAVNSGVEFDGTGSWMFMDDYEDSGNSGRMVLIRGTLITNGNNLNINGFQSQGSGVRHLDLVSSEITIRTSGGSYSWFYQGSNHTIDAGTSHINLVGALNSTGVNTGFRGALNHAYHHVTYSNPLSTVGRFSGPVFVEKLTFMGNATIVSSSNTIDTLILSAGKKYAFGGGQTQTIGSYLSANSPLCSGLIEMVSATAGSATLQFSPGSVANINNTLIENIAATGNVPVTANNSFDLGGNTNFIFPPATGQTLYWVGGSGDWNDASHWSLVNDGVYPAVGGCVPTPADDVVFNVNSGFTSGNNVVTLDGAGHYCHDMTWVGAQATPEIIGAVGNPLNVYGSWTLQANMSYRVRKTNFRSSSLGETLTTNGTIINLSATNSGVEFDG